jgi:hypothetical protein
MIIDCIDGYVPKEESLKFFSWCNMMFGPDDNETPLMHYYLVDEILTGHGKFIGEMFRGSAKTTNLSHKMPLYVATMGKLPNFGNVKNAVLISDTFEQADTQLQSCMAYYNNSDVLQSFLTLVKRKEGMLLFENKDGHRFHISARGAGQSFRGTNYEGQRPQWIIGDDLQSDEILTNKDAPRKLIAWWVGTVLQAVDINRFKISVIGTPMIDGDLISLLMKSPEYNKVRFPVAQGFSLDPTKIKSNWADRFTPDKIISMYNDAKALGAEGEFFRELFLETANEETQIFKKDWFKKYSLKKMAKDKLKYNFFTSMDLAVSRKEKADRTVIITIGVNADGHWFVAGIDVGRFNPSEVIDLLFKQVRRWKPLEVRAEKAALQQVLGHFIEERMMKENTHFLYNPLTLNTTTKKEVRIMGLQPKFKNRMVHFPEDEYQDEIILLEKEILGQTRETNTTGHDDIIDTLANFLDPDFIVKPSDYDEKYYGEMQQLSLIDSTVF